MKALHLVEPNKIELVDIPTPQNLKKGEVLVKMAYSPINPSDLAFLTGGYGVQRPLPTVPGFEGSGEVIASGGGFYANYLKGKRVACVANNKGDGTWAEYMLTDATKCVVLSKSVSYEQASMSFVNPLTAVELGEMAKKEGYGGIVMDAAASSLSKMVLYQARKHGLGFAGVVRKESQVQELQSRRVDLVVNSSADNWEGQLKEWAGQYGKILFLDAVGGGSLPFDILRCLPAQSKMIIYGRLDFENPPVLSPQDFIFYEYKLEGYWLSKTASRKSFLKSMSDTRKVQTMLKDGFETTIQKSLQLDNYKEAFELYSKNMSGGKVLFDLNK